MEKFDPFPLSSCLNCSSLWILLFKGLFSFLKYTNGFQGGTHERSYKFRYEGNLEK